MRRHLPPEALVWLGGLALVAVLDPAAPGWFSVCPFHHFGEWLGVPFCPGCGLGRSIGWLARGEFERSLAAHPLGIPAVGMLGARSVVLLRARRNTASR
jgi:hypothetical protein